MAMHCATCTCPRDDGAVDAAARYHELDVNADFRIINPGGSMYAVGALVSEHALEVERARMHDEGIDDSDIEVEVL